MFIRKMLNKDIEKIYEIGIKVERFAVSYKSRFYSKEHLKKWIKNGKTDILLVAEDYKKLIGFLMCTYHKYTDSAIINDIFVNEKYQIRGVGKKLIEECLTKLKNMNASYVYVQTKVENKQAIDFFSKLGFNKGYDFSWMELSF